MLAALGFSSEEIDAANTYCCGTMTLEGSQYIKDETCLCSIVPILVEE